MRRKWNSDGSLDSCEVLRIIRFSFLHIAFIITNLVSSRRSDLRHCVFPIEQCSSLLESTVFRFDDEYVAVDRLERYPAAVHNIVLPCNVLECNWIYILVEDESNGDSEIENVESFCTKIEWQDFDTVRHDQWRKSKAN